MYRKAEILIIGSVYIALITAISFFWMPLPLSIALKVSSVNPVHDIVCTVLFNAAIVIGLALTILSMDDTGIWRYNCKKRIKQKLFLLFSELAIIELLYFVLQMISEFQFGVAEMIISVIKWSAIIITLIYAIVPETKMKMGRIVMCAGILVAAGIFAIAVFNRKFELIESELMLYSIDDVKYSDAMNYLKYESQIFFLLFDAFAGVVIWIIFISQLEIVPIKESTRFKAALRTMLAINIIGMIIVSISSLKIAFLPHSSLGKASRYVKMEVADGRGFAVGYRTDITARNGNPEVPVFQRAALTQYTIHYGSKIIYSFSIPGEYYSNGFSVQSRREAEKGLMKLTIDVYEVYVLHDRVIYYERNDAAILTDLCALDDVQLDGVIIKTCEQLISEGNLMVYNYTLDYMMQHNADFILPYVARYANGEFSEDEKGKNKDINLEYIMQISRDAIGGSAA